ncbi:substrate-binding domain-containing protein [Maridesulfovibrio zosterae]|uniref:substrate-binding domain-containing protein n=1 Tax=Maridesulfovibrio zosterae TaxID=82171 RepID=UPI000401BEEA|nr:substrate-binding domain-containing protein [Maridesulfovibrio zosterae]
MARKNSCSSKILSILVILVVLSAITNSVAMVMAAESKAGSATDNKRMTFEDMLHVVKAASSSSPEWNGPLSGPSGKHDQYIAIICEDLKNGGILHVAQGVQEAASVIKWRVQVYDAEGTPQGRKKAFADALASNPDGIALIGADANAVSSGLQQAYSREIPVVGWHVSPVAGRLLEGPIVMNISTDPAEVAKITALAAITSSHGKAGVVIFTDSNFAIAMKKANIMADIIKSYPSCELLEIVDVAISNSSETVPDVVKTLLTKYGDRWTCTLAINDIYFDYAVPTLIVDETKSDKLNFLSAGDGSNAAFLRIQTGTLQTHTVAEPLNMQGWQIVDELNRLMSGENVTGYIAPPHLVTTDNALSDGGSQFLFDPDNGYKDIYKTIWKR